MKRLIYLEDAIDAVAEGLKRTFVEYRDVAEKMLNKVPSAQPYTDAEVQKMQDLEQAQFEKVYQLGYEEGKKAAQPEQTSEIQDILEYLDTVLQPIISPDHWNVYSELHDMISMLPSAQSEIIRCKDCKNSEHWYRDRRRCFLWSEDGVSVFDDGFCNYAERRQDG